MKPKVLVTWLTGTERTHWANPVLVMDMILMARDPRFDCAFQPVSDHRPFSFARNKAITLARDMGADFLLSFDCDNYVDGNPLDVIAEMGEHQDVVGLTCGVGAAPDVRLFPSHNHGANDGPFREEQSVGGAVLIVRDTVWQRIPRGPYFRWVDADNELCAPDVGGMDEVTYFCNLVREHNFKLWTHRSMLAGHLKTAELTGLVDALNGLKNLNQ